MKTTICYWFFNLSFSTWCEIFSGGVPQSSVLGLFKQTIEWTIELNKQNCTLMHIDYKNGNHSHKICDWSDEYDFEDTTAERVYVIIFLQT